MTVQRPMTESEETHNDETAMPREYGLTISPDRARSNRPGKTLSRRRAAGPDYGRRVTFINRKARRGAWPKRPKRSSVPTVAVVHPQTEPETTNWFCREIYRLLTESPDLCAHQRISAALVQRHWQPS